MCAFACIPILIDLKPKAAQVQANGDLHVARARDGHFYVPGTVNGQPVDFLVDTGASLVSVSATVAEAAGLHGGVATTFHTANGSHAGRVVDGVEVAVGPVRVTNVRVGIGLQMGDARQALLGQSFLSNFHGAGRAAPNHEILGYASVMQCLYIAGCDVFLYLLYFTLNLRLKQWIGGHATQNR